MASSSKRPRSTIAPPSTSHLSYLLDPNLASTFEKFSTYDILQDRFVQFQDLQNYEVDTLFEASGLINLLSCDNMTPCFPFLVKLFYTNMTYTNPPQPNAIMSSVKNVPIKFSPQRLGNILTIPHTGLALKSIKIDNEEVIAKMLNPGVDVKPGLNATNLQPQARIISRILSWSMIPKSGSYSYISMTLLKCTYAILAGLNVNWAKIIYDNMTKPTSSTLYHGSFLTKVFQAFKIDVMSERIDVLPNTPYFDKVALSRMSLPYDPNQQEYGSGGEEEEEEEEHVEVESPPIEEPQNVDNTVDYSDLVNRVERMSTTQDRLVASHYVMQYQISHMRESQDELLRRFNQQFPPPPQ